MWQMASLRGWVKYNTFLSRFKSVIISSNKGFYIPHLMGVCSLLNSTGSNINSVNSSQSLPVIIPVCSLCVFLQLCYLSWRGDWPGFSNALFPVCDGRNIWCTRVLPKLVRFKSNLWFGSSVTNFSTLKWSIKTCSSVKILHILLLKQENVSWHWQTFFDYVFHRPNNWTLCCLDIHICRFGKFYDWNLCILFFSWCTIGIMHTIRMVPPSNLWGKCVFPDWLESGCWRLLAVTGWNLLQKGYCTKNVLWLGTQTRNTEHCNPKIKDVPYHCTGTKIFQKAQLSFWMQMVFNSRHIFPHFYCCLAIS